MSITTYRVTGGAPKYPALKATVPVVHTPSTMPAAQVSVPPTDTTVVIDNTVFVRYALAAAATTVPTEVVAAPAFIVRLAGDLGGRTIVPGSVDFDWGDDRYIDRLGQLYKNPDPVTGQGVSAGTINYDTGVITLTSYATGSNQITVRSLLTRLGRQFLTNFSFRTPGAPLRPGSFSILGVASDGTQLAATSNFDGSITGPGVSGYVDVESGVVILLFGEYVIAAGNEAESWYDAGLLVGDGSIWRPYFAVADSLFYTCVVYSYLPLDADLLGLDPVRLPSDGRVPVVRRGDVVVVHNTQVMQLAAPLTEGQAFPMPRPDVVAVRLYDAAGIYVPTTKYSFDSKTQLLTMATPLDLTGFTEPLVANHRIEDMSLVSDVQINGDISLAAPLGHDYPVADTWVSSALLFGDLAARLYGFFDQKTWTSTWSNALIGDSCLANYNEVVYPPLVTNSGAIQERWALVFDSTTHFIVVGETVGVVADGYISTLLQPINPATNTPYFRLALEGWGSGWAAGNVVRFNTEAANHDVWIARTTLSGPVTTPDDKFTLQIRGDAA